MGDVFTDENDAAKAVVVVVGGTLLQERVGKIDECLSELRGDEIQGAMKRVALGSTTDSSSVSSPIDTGWWWNGQTSPGSLSSFSWAIQKTPKAVAAVHICS